MATTAKHEHADQAAKASSEVKPLDSPTPLAVVGTIGADRGSQSEITDSPPDAGMTTVALEQRKRSRSQFNAC